MFENRQIPTDITGTFEVIRSDNHLDETSNKNVKYIKQQTAAKWQKEYIPLRNHPNNIEEHYDPYVLFCLFFDDIILNTIVDYSIKYSTSKNRNNFKFDINDLWKWLGIVILSGYHVLPQIDLYWSLDEDKGVSLVRKTMSRN
ncbi:Transposase IS4 [Popillia japonica]|uniref:Transposase IS4 n=1 Tax=Popillia japonica TaxID=7064 RepID=A0AAW1KQ63_POPJA